MRIRTTALFLSIIVAFGAAALAIMYVLSRAPVVSYYCSTANPLGITYTDLSGRTKRVKVDVVYRMKSGRNGYLAYYNERGGRGIIHIRRHGRYVRSVRLPRSPYGDFYLGGWLHGQLVFWQDGKRCSLDPATGKVGSTRPWVFPLTVHELPRGYVTVTGEADRYVTLYDERSKRVRRWWYTSLFDQTTGLIGDRYLVVSQRGRLLIIDTVRKTRRDMKSGQFDRGFCTGRTPEEMLIALRGNQTGRGGPGNSTQIVAVDMRTLGRRTVYEAKGQLEIVGMSRNRTWLLVLRPYAAVGPSRLIAIRLSDGRTRVLQENVYECALVE